MALPVYTHPAAHRHDWTHTLAERAAGRTPGFRGSDETDEEFAAREARGWAPEPVADPRTTRRPARRDASRSAARRKPAPAKKAAAKKATAKKAAGRAHR